MSKFLLLFALGLCVSSMLTILGARILSRTGWRPPFLLWFLIVSLSSPLAWIAFQSVALALLLPDPGVHAGLVRNWPLYLREVVLGISLKLWICGTVCTGGLALFERWTSDGPVRDVRAQLKLGYAGAAIAASILMPITMNYWIEHGRVSPRFAFAALGCAFLVGLLPMLLTSFALLRIAGARAHRRYAEPIVALYAAIIGLRGYAWYQAIASRPGAYAVLAVDICAIIGALVGWFFIRSSNRAAGAALEQ